jgi:ADP-ribose pyrophosphatase YjhB (NUDIX family)
LTQESNSLALFEERGWITDGEYTPKGLAALAELLGPLPTVWGKTMKGNSGRWGAAFVPLMSKLVPFATELAIIKDRQILLTWREFEGTVGWHTSGTYVEPGEEWQDTVSRLARREVGCDAVFIRQLHTFTNPRNPRFHDLTVLVRCEMVGEPMKSKYDPSAGDPVEGQFAWFSEKPDNILPFHDRYWPIIAEALLV